jgi:hypothetical protein
MSTVFGRYALLTMQFISQSSPSVFPARTITCSDLIPFGALLDYIPRLRLGLCENRGAVLLTLGS